MHYTITRHDVGSNAHSYHVTKEGKRRLLAIQQTLGRIMEQDIGKVCVYVPANDPTAAGIWQVESAEQMSKRLSASSTR